MRAFAGLVVRELREDVPYAAGLLAVTCVLCVVSVALSAGQDGAASAYQYTYMLTLLVPIAAAAIGARRFSAEYTSGAALLLGSAPLPRWMVWLTKALVGYAVYFVCCAVPIAVRLSPGFPWSAESTPYGALSVKAALGSGLTPYLLALIISSLGKPGLTAAVLSLVGGTAASALLGGAMMRVQAAGPGGWLASGPTLTLLYGYSILSRLLPALLAVAGLIAYARCMPGEPRRSWPRAAGLVLSMAVLGLGLSLGAGAAMSRLRTPAAAGEIRSAHCAADGSRVLFRAEAALPAMAGSAHWALKTGSDEPFYLGSGMTSAEWSERLGGYVLTAGRYVTDGTRELWLLRPGQPMAPLGSMTANDSRMAFETRVIPSPDGTVAALCMTGVEGSSVSFVAPPGVQTPSELVRPGDGFLGWGDDAWVLYVARPQGVGGKQRTAVLRLARGAQPVTLAEVDGSYLARAPESGQWAVLVPEDESINFEPPHDGWAVNLKTGERSRLAGLEGLSTCTVSPDGTRLAALSRPFAPGTLKLRVYDLATGRIVADGLAPWRTIQLCPDAGTGSGSGSLTYSPDGPMWSPDGRRLATWVDVGAGDVSVLVWDLQGAEARHRPIAVKGPKRALAGWWADGRLVAVTLPAEDTAPDTSSSASRRVRPNLTGEIALLDPDTGDLQRLYETRPLRAR